MPVRLTNTQVAHYLRQGPLGAATPATPQQVIRLATQRPEIFDDLMRKSYYAIAEASFKRPTRELWKRYREFIAPWAGKIDRETMNSVVSAVEAYEMATRAGMGDLTAESDPADAAKVARALEAMATSPGSMTEMIVTTLQGQAESLVSREQAAQTLEAVRRHRFATIIPDYSWDNGALSYYSRSQIEAGGLNGKFSADDVIWEAAMQPTSTTAFFISVDPNFFRMYAPMMLFNAQQIPDVDLVLLICAEEAVYDDLLMEASVYMEALSGLNGQPPAENVIPARTGPPEWVNDMHAFYACLRFLALPQVLERYENVYMMDADLIMKDDPAGFLKRTASVPFATPYNPGTVGVIPWRRYMAGSVLSNRQVVGTGVLENLFDYIEFGLQQGFAWTLDQNALSYAAENEPKGIYHSLEKHPRPVVASSFMSRWEKNYRLRRS